MSHLPAPHKPTPPPPPLYTIAEHNYIPDQKVSHLFDNHQEKIKQEVHSIWVEGFFLGSCCSFTAVMLSTVMIGAFR